MYSWRITKYNPNYRGGNDSYEREQWTGFSDINKSFDGEILSSQEYLETEKSYLNQIQNVLRKKNIKLLRVIALEKYDKSLNPECNENIYPKKLYEFYPKIEEGMIVDVDDALLVSQLVLRSDLWCKLVGFDGEIEVHFGYDFYMYIVSVSNIIASDFLNNGLYIEEFVSPHL